MATDTSVAITPGSGENIHVIKQADGKDDQVFREAPATAVAGPSTWTLAASAQASVLAASAARRSLILTNPGSTAWVYVRYDTTGPSAGAAGTWHDAIPPGGRLEVPKELCTQPVSLVASGADAANPLHICEGTAA